MSQKCAHALALTNPLTHPCLHCTSARMHAQARAQARTSACTHKHARTYTYMRAGPWRPKRAKTPILQGQDARFAGPKRPWAEHLLPGCKPKPIVAGFNVPSEKGQRSLGVLRWAGPEGRNAARCGPRHAPHRSREAPMRGAPLPGYHVLAVRPVDVRRACGEARIVLASRRR